LLFLPFSIWVLLSGFFSVLLPVWESRKEMGMIVKGLGKGLRRRA
jgi:urea-proton symporter